MRRPGFRLRSLPKGVLQPFCGEVPGSVIPFSQRQQGSRLAPRLVWRYPRGGSVPIHCRHPGARLASLSLRARVGPVGGGVHRFPRKGGPVLRGPLLGVGGRSRLRQRHHGKAGCPVEGGPTLRCGGHRGGFGLCGRGAGVKVLALLPYRSGPFNASTPLV